MTILYWLLAAWLLWCAGNLALMLLLRPAGPSCTGNRVHVPDTLHGLLTGQEFEAVLAHEQGHRFHLHAWENYLRLCVFCPANLKRRMQQELEADNYAAWHGHSMALSTALRKLSDHPVDEYRASRLSAWLA